jgi:glycosyltransferase involved in cell wall biosynthesis
MAEWFGRGGIAHTAQAWVRELDSAAIPSLLVTRAGRELAAAVPGSIAVRSRGGALASHVAALHTVRGLLRGGRFTHLVLHGSVAPQLETQLLGVARSRGTRSILVAHESALSRRSPAGAHSLARLVRGADVVVAHSRFVASALEEVAGRRNFVLLPLPLPLGLVGPDARALHSGSSVVDAGELPVALHFGHLHRGYKGSATVVELAGGGVPGWRLALVGKGAPASVTGALSVDRFLDPADLTATIAGSAASLLPYDRASQSAAVVLAQALGSVVIATAVGGIPEQIEDRVTGLLLAPQSPPGRWREALLDLSDVGVRERIAGAARASVVAAHREFAEGIVRLVT